MFVTVVVWVLVILLRLFAGRASWKNIFKPYQIIFLQIGVAIPNFPENLGREQFLPDASTLLLEFILHKRSLKFSRPGEGIIYYAFLSNLNNIDTYVARRNVKTGDRFNPPSTRQNNLLSAPVINTYKPLVSIKEYVILINNTAQNKRTHL